MTPLQRFLAEAEARLSKEPETDFQHEFLPDLERQAPLSVREAKYMLSLLKAFAAVVEHAKKIHQVDLEAIESLKAMSLPGNEDSVASIVNSNLVREMGARLKAADSAVAECCGEET